MKQGQIVNKLVTVILIISPILCFCKEKLKDHHTDSIVNPLNVEVKTNADLAVSVLISKAGGTLTAQGADGSRYTLTFPNGALFKDEKITIIPIKNIVGLHFSGAEVGGLQMAPEGLRLSQPAILIIESPKVVASSGFETVAFGYHQQGEGLYLNLAEIKGNKMIIEVWHFCGVGAAQATPAEIQTQHNQYIPSNNEDAFTQQMQEYLGLERKAQLLRLQQDPALDKAVDDLIRKEYDDFIAPLLPIALTDCAKAPANISRALSWARKVELWGYKTFNTEVNKIMETWDQVKINCLRRVYKVTDAGYPEVTLSGVVCDLEKPFTIQMVKHEDDHEDSYSYKFTPSSPEAGKVMFDETFLMDEYLSSHEIFTGTYTVKKNSENMLGISVTGKYCVYQRLKKKTIQRLCFDYPSLFVLIYFVTNECNQQ
jgi:hypothetical protein